MQMVRVGKKYYVLLVRNITQLIASKIEMYCK